MYNCSWRVSQKGKQCKYHRRDYVKSTLKGFVDLCMVTTATRCMFWRFFNSLRQLRWVMFIVCDLCILPHPRSSSMAVVSLWSQEKGGWQDVTASSLRDGAGIVYGQQFWRHCLYRWVDWSMRCLWRMGMFDSTPMLLWPQPL